MRRSRGGGRDGTGARTWLHRILETPLVYRLFQAIFSPLSADALYRAYDEVYGTARGRVLDLGSGPRPDTPLPEGVMIGLDVNPRYVRDYLRGGGEAAGCTLLGVVASGAALPFPDAVFDEGRCAAVFHHLPDELAGAALREMLRTARPGGRVAIFDMVWPPSFLSSPVGWLICRFDRGRWVRTEQELLRLAERSCGGSWEARPLFYTWARLRGVFLIRSVETTGVPTPARRG